jgi:hypothetical protein
MPAIDHKKAAATIIVTACAWVIGGLSFIGAPIRQPATTGLAQHGDR